jgi:hypothetical protein
MAEKLCTYNTVSNLIDVGYDTVTTSAGTVDAGKVPLTGADGKLSASLVPLPPGVSTSQGSLDAGKLVMTGSNGKIDNSLLTIPATITSSAGSSDAGKLPLTSSDGKLDNSFLRLPSTVSSSSGSTDANKIPLLNASGKLDNSFITFPSFPPTVVASSGTADANKLIMTTSAGKLDSSLIPTGSGLPEWLVPGADATSGGGYYLQVDGTNGKHMELNPQGGGVYIGNPTAQLAGTPETSRMYDILWALGGISILGTDKGNSGDGVALLVSSGTSEFDGKSVHINTSKTQPDGVTSPADSNWTGSLLVDAPSLFNGGMRVNGEFYCTYSGFFSTGISTYGPIVAYGGITNYGDITNLGTYTINGSIETLGGLALAQTSVTTNYSVLKTNFTVWADATTDAITITLPDATDCNLNITTPGEPITGKTGRMFIIKKVDETMHSVTINTVSGQKIEGTATYTLDTPHSFVMVQTDGANWRIVGVNAHPVMFPVWLAGKPDAGMVIFKAKTTIPFKFLTGLYGWQVDIGVNPAATAVYSFRKNGVEFGTLSIATNGTPTWTCTSSVAFVPGDLFTIVAPATQDSTLSDVAVTAYGVTV